VYRSLWNSDAELTTERHLPYAIWDHTTTCHLTQVNVPHPSQTGQ